MGVPVHPFELQPGDLVFYYSPVSHVGIYIGDSKVVHAGNESTGVAIADVGMPGYAFGTRIV
jgi:cell wall-associated NlpC family hydrolase